MHYRDEGRVLVWGACTFYALELIRKPVNDSGDGSAPVSRRYYCPVAQWRSKWQRGSSCWSSRAACQSLGALPPSLSAAWRMLCFDTLAFPTIFFSVRSEY